MLTNLRNIGFIFLYISIWLSLDSSIYNVINLQNANFFEIIISFRFVVPYIIVALLVILFIKDFLLIKLNGNFKYLIYLLFFCLLIQAIKPIFNDNNLFNVTFALISIILLINLVYFYNYFDLKKIYLIGLTILFFVTLVYGSVLIKHLIFESPNLNLYGHWPKNLAAVQFLSNEVPRSSGISRSSFILMIPLGFYFLTNKKLNYKIYFFYLFFSFLMLATQSRITLLGYLFGVLVFTFYIFFLPTKNNFKDKLKKFLIIIILPVFTWAASLELLSLTRSTPAFLEYFSDKFGNENIDDEKYKKLFRKSNKKSFSSNRTKDWRNIFDKNQNYFFGYGALGDRHLIDQSASSLHFYNYASGGIFAVFVFFILIFRSIYICFRTIFKIYKIPDSNNYLILSACFVILFLILRSTVESSFAVFGIDYLVFFSSYFYVEQTYKKLR